MKITILGRTITTTTMSPIMETTETEVSTRVETTEPEMTSTTTEIPVEIEILGQTENSEVPQSQNDDEPYHVSVDIDEENYDEDTEYDYFNENDLTEMITE